MANAVVGIVRTIVLAEKVVANLQEGGFSRSDISVVVPDGSGKDFADRNGTKAPEGATSGAGGVIGGTLGLLAGIGAFAVSGLEAMIYESKIKRGNVLVAVHTQDDLMRKVAETILLENGAESVSAVADAAVPKMAHA